jgi:hypothetical protein
MKKFLVLVLVWALGSLGALMFLKEMVKALESAQDLESE